MPDQSPKIPVAEGLPLILAGIGRQEARFRRMLDATAGYLRAGEIPNPRFDELRPTAIAAAGEAWRSGVTDALWKLSRRDSGLSWSEADAVGALAQAVGFGPHDGMPQMLSLRRRVGQALAKTPHPSAAAVLERAAPLLAEIGELADALGWLRDRRVKRAPPGTGKPAPVLPEATLAAQAAVRGVMRATLLPLKEQFKARVSDYVEREASELERLCADLAALLREHRAGGADEARAARIKTLKKEAMEAYRSGQHKVSYDPNTYATRRLRNADARTAAFAERQTEDAFHLCTERNVDKIAPIAEAAGGVDIRVVGASASASGVETRLAVSLPTGASFAFTNGIVWGRSSGRVVYCQFPARFHDVTLADGTRLSNPSEERVKNALCAPVAGPAEAPPPTPGPR
jgi:hypothetical protein